MGLSFLTHSRILFSSEHFHYKIFIHKKCLEKENDKFQENLSRPVIIDARIRYRAAVRRLRNTGLDYYSIPRSVFGCNNCVPVVSHADGVKMEPVIVAKVIRSEKREEIFVIKVLQFGFQKHSY